MFLQASKQMPPPQSSIGLHQMAGKPQCNELGKESRKRGALWVLQRQRRETGTLHGQLQWRQQSATSLCRCLCCATAVLHTLEGYVEAPLQAGNARLVSCRALRMVERSGETF